MKSRLPFLLATLGFVLTIFPAYRYAISDDNDGRMPPDGGDRHLSDSVENCEIQEGDAVQVVLADAAARAFLRAGLGQDPQYREDGQLKEWGGTLTFTTEVTHVDTDVVRVEITFNPDLESNGSDNYRSEFQCTFPREMITCGTDAEPGTDDVGEADSNTKPQSPQARVKIRDLDVCSEYRIQSWKLLSHLEK